jgi:CRP-like cAMP-binding protein
MTNPETVLDQVPLFSILSKKELANLMHDAHERTLPIGAVLTDEEAIGTTFGVIVEGHAAVTVNGKLARTLGPGDYFGEMALIDSLSARRLSPLRRSCAACCSPPGSSGLLP